MTLSATDLDLGLRTAVEATVEGGGSVLLPGRLLAEVARSLADDTVEIETREAERDVEIRSGSLELPPAGAAGRGLPDAAERATASRSRSRPPRSAESIDLVARAASRDDMRPVLTGVFVTASGNEMTMVATDSYRLAVKRTELETALSGEIEANIPARALRELARILAGEGVDEAAITLQPNQAIFEAGVDHADHAADRGPVPELPPAPARVLRARRAAAAVGVPRRGAADQPAGAAQRAAAVLLRAGRADRLGGDARRRRRARDDARRLRGRADGDRLQPRVPARGDRKRRPATRCCCG